MYKAMLEGLVYCRKEVEELFHKASKKLEESLDYVEKIRDVLVERGVPNGDYIVEGLLSTYFLMLARVMAKKYGVETTLASVNDFIDTMLNPKKFVEECMETYEEIKKIEEEVGLGQLLRPEGRSLLNQSSLIPMEKLTGSMRVADKHPLHRSKTNK